MLAVAHTLAYDITLLGDSRVPAERLARISVPTLALAGDAGSGWMADAARAVAQTVPDGQFGLLAGQGHDVAAEALTPVLVDFFRQ
jgi:pimeloyl-ACP methyl ester carboxylesterase